MNHDKGCPTGNDRPFHRVIGVLTYAMHFNRLAVSCAFCIFEATPYYWSLFYLAPLYSHSMQYE